LKRPTTKESERPVQEYSREYTIRDLMDYQLPISVEDRSMMLREKVDAHAAMESEIEDLRAEVARLVDEVDEYKDKHGNADSIEEIKTALRGLVDAFDRAKIGKMARVGSLVICIEQDIDDAHVLGGALERARKAL
jgi:soluble cytochrome b562